MDLDDTLLEGAILQRDNKTYAIIPRIPGGILTPDILDKISGVVKKFNLPMVKITSGNRIALIGVKKNDIAAVWKELGMEVAHAKGLCFYYVQSCPGTDFCKYGIQDSTGLGIKLEKTFYNMKLPAKVKIGVSGCNMCCANSFIKDIGVIGKRLGWTVALGGRAGTMPRAGLILAKNLTDEDVIRILIKFLEYYAKNANKDVRTSRFVEKVGIEKLKEILLT